MEENKMGVMPMKKLIMNMALPMILSMLIGALYNVVDSLFVSRFSEDALSAVFDPILIFGYFGFPTMGAKGAAIATVFAQIVSMVLGVIFNLAKNKEIELSPRKFSFDFRYIKTICAVGIPTMLMQSMSSVMCFGINKLLLGYSTTATAVFGAYFKLQTFVYMAVFGLNNALIPIVAYNYGAKKGERIKSAIFLWELPEYGGAFSSRK
jgi:Na+-driven multidrug efflux pump